MRKEARAHSFLRWFYFWTSFKNKTKQVKNPPWISRFFFFLFLLFLLCLFYVFWICLFCLFWRAWICLCNNNDDSVSRPNWLIVPKPHGEVTGSLGNFFWTSWPLELGSLWIQSKVMAIWTGLIKLFDLFYWYDDGLGSYQLLLWAFTIFFRFLYKKKKFSHKIPTLSEVILWWFNDSVY